MCNNDMYIGRCNCGARMYISAEAIRRYFNGKRDWKTIKAVCEFKHVTRLKMDEDLKDHLYNYYINYCEE